VPCLNHIQQNFGSHETGNRIVDPIKFEPYGVTLYAVAIPIGAEGIWGELSHPHGAVALYNRKGESMNYFPAQSAATYFQYEVDKMMHPVRIYDGIPGTRKDHDQLVKDFDELISSGQPTADEYKIPAENESTRTFRDLIKSLSFWLGNVCHVEKNQWKPSGTQTRGYKIEDTPRWVVRPITKPY